MAENDQGIEPSEAAIAIPLGSDAKTQYKCDLDPADWNHYWFKSEGSPFTVNCEFID